jgi:hypothetical protein
MKDPYRRDGWEPLREQLSPYSSDGDWNQPGRLPYQAQSGVWHVGPDAASGYQRGARRGGNTIRSVTIGVVALAVLAAAWVFYRAHAGLHATSVTTAITIPIINATWAPPAPGAAPAMTAEQAWQKRMHMGAASSITAQLGLITQPMGSSSQCGYACDGLPVQNGIAYRALDQLAYGYYWTACAPGANLPAAQCWNWLFLDANTGKLITGASYNAPRGPGPGP